MKCVVVQKRFAIKVLSFFLVTCLFFFCAFVLHGKTEDVDPEVLLQQVPLGARLLNQKVSLSDSPYVYWESLAVILNSALIDRGYLTPVPPFSENPATDPNLERIPAETVESVFNSLFGPGSFDLIRHDRFWGRGALEYVESSDEYVYFENPGGGGPAIDTREEVLSVEETGDTLILKVRYGLFHFDSPHPCSIFADDSILNATVENPDARLVYVDESVGDWLLEGRFDEYLPVYAHTFKSNGDGAYYWESTEMIEAPKEIPEWMGVRPSSAKSDSVSDDPVTGLPATDGGMNTGIEPSVTEDEFPLLWFLSGIGIGIVVLGIPLILLSVRKKRKQKELEKVQI